MDLTAEMILLHLRREHLGEVEAERFCPSFRRRLTRSTEAGRGFAFNVDRILNRYLDYAGAVRRLASSDRFDVFHLVDHSYSQLVHSLPPGRALVTCHDLDTFRCLLEPEAESRPLWFRALTRRTLDGLRKAAFVTCDSDATREAVMRHGLLPKDRLKTIYLGTHPECSPLPDPEADRRAEALVGFPKKAEAVELLHVGSNIPRKRIDVLLRVFAEVLATRPDARLLKVGGTFTPEQDRLARELGVFGRIVFLPFFSPAESRDRATLAAIYRRADVLLQPSDAEGFGLPLAEAIACGTRIVASDIPVLREVAGEWATYAKVGDVKAWVEATLSSSIAPRPTPPEKSRFHWTRHVDDLVKLYREMCRETV